MEIPTPVDMGMLARHHREKRAADPEVCGPQTPCGIGNRQTGRPGLRPDAEHVVPVCDMGAPVASGSRQRRKRDGFQLP